MDKPTWDLDTGLANLLKTLGKYHRDRPNKTEFKCDQKRLEHVLVDKIWINKNQSALNMYQVTGS